MKRFIILLLFLFLCGGVLAAQFTTVTGTVLDPHSVPYSLGTISPTLVVPAGAGAPTLNGFAYSPPTQPVGLNSVGTFIFNVADSAVLLPAGTKWNFTVCSAAGSVSPSVGTGPQCFTLAAPITITGASQDISTQLNAVALALTIPIGTGSGCSPVGLNSLQYNNAGNCGGIPNAAPGSVLASQGTSTRPAFQIKAIYDTHDWATCDTPIFTATGTDATAGILNMLSKIGTQQATVRPIGTGNPTNSCLVSTISWPANVTLDFSGGGSFTLINTITPPGGGALDGSVASAFNTSASSCSVTLNVPTAGDAVVLLTNFRFVGGGGLGLPTDTGGNVYRLVSASNADSNHYSSNTFGWVASNVAGGSITITIPYLAAPPASTCAAFAVSGLGPSVGADGPGAQCANSCGTGSPYSTVASATYTAGSFLVAFGGNNATTETCTAGGAFTQILDIGTNMNLCAQIIPNTAGGAITATQAINNTPTGNTWDYNSFGLKPVATTEFIQGGILNPNLHQVFYQATSGPSVDFTGNLVIPTVYPEWWGATPSSTAAVNTLALQAAEHGAFGTSRTNASGLALYNKQLYLSGLYSINDELKFYDVVGNSTSRWNITCAAGGGLKQTATNKRIWDGQANAYGTINRCSFQDSASSTNALVDMDYDGITTPADLATQFITCYDCSFVGNGIVDTGWLISKSGGAAQGSNIYCINCSGQGFTGAVEQIGGNGTGRNAGRFYALNALNIGWIGDMQNCPNFGFASYGGGYIEIDNSSFECTSPLASYLTQAATAVDVYCEATQGPCTVSNTRSEDLQLIHGSSPKVINSTNTDQSTAFYSPVNCLAGGSEPLNWFIHGSDLGSDGALYQETVHGTAFGGYCLSQASSGTPTTITDTNQLVVGSVTIGTFPGTIGELMTQAVTGATGTRLSVPASTGTITGSVTSGTIGSGHTMTQAVTTVTCTSTNAPTGTQSLTCNNFSGTADNSHIWTDGTTSGTYTPTAAPVFSVASPVLIITAATGAPDNSHDWVGGTSGAHLTPTAVPVNQVNWSVNQFVGGAGAQQQVTIWGGTGAGQICSPITANTATSITFTSCASNYYGVHSGNADNTSQFIVEPCWGCGVTQSGDVTFAKVNPIVIGGDNINTSAGACSIDTVTASGGLVNCNANAGKLTQIRNLLVTRADWYNGLGGIGSNVSDVLVPQLLSQVQVLRPFSSLSGASLNWSIAGRNTNTNIFKAPMQTDIGNAPIVTHSAQAGGGPAANDVVFGTRSDPSAGSDTFRNRFEICTTSAGGICSSSMIGAPAPSAFNVTNQNGTPTQIGGGPPTGSGTPGNIEFWLSPGGGGSGATVQSGAKVASITPTGFQAAAYNTTTNCAAVGSAASPSVAACGSASAGSFSCATNAVNTCTVNTTLVTANSEIFISQREDATTGTRLGVTCNATPSTVIPTDNISAVVPGVSFSFSLTQPVTNPDCFSYHIVN